MSREKIKFQPKALLSIHIPKTGGTSLREVLLARFGRNLLLDYGYATKRKNPETNIMAIQTHNPYIAYEDVLSQPRILTILREPLERAISHYYYWLNIPLTDDPEPHGDIFIKHFRDNKSDLSTFLLSGDDWLKNIYTEHFLCPLHKPEDFWFVGFLETFNEDIVDLQKLLGLKPKTPPVLNKGKKPAESISEQVKTEFYRLNKLDKEFYDMMLSERNVRKQTIGAWTTEAVKGKPKQNALDIIKSLFSK